MALKLYQKAATLGNIEAQYNLAFMYENGKGIERDMDQAIYWYEKSARSGCIRALFKLNDLLRINQ